MAEYNPIWKQFGVDCGSGESASVLVQIGGTTTELFSGKAWRKPDASAITFYPNDIARTLFADDTPDLSRVTNITELTTAIVDVTADGVLVAERVGFLQDYSYKEHSRSILSDIVGSGIVVPWNCPVVISFMPGTYEVEKEYLSGGSPTSQTFTFTEPTTLTLQRAGLGVDCINIDGEEIKISQCGCDYAVMWRNRYGGYECLPMFGLKKQTDNLTRNSFNRLFTQTAEYMAERAEVPYLNEVKETLTMNSGIVFNDVQANMIADLLASPAVWLLENLPISKHEPRAINITNSSAEHLTYKSNGYQPMRFAITAEVAQPRERR